MSNVGNHRCTTPVPGALVAGTVVGLKKSSLVVGSTNFYTSQGGFQGAGDPQPVGATPNRLGRGAPNAPNAPNTFGLAAPNVFRA